MSINRVLGCHDSITQPALHLPLHKLQTIKYRASQLLCKDTSKQNITVREVAQFIRTANAVAVAIPPASLFDGSLQATKIIFKIRRGGAEQYRSSVCYRQRGAKLVDGASQVMESSQPAPTSQLGKDNYRCIQLELGSSLQGDDHSMTLVTNKGLVPHKLPGNASSLPSSSVLYKRHSSPPHGLSLYGQHCSTLVPKSQRKDNSSLPLHASKTNLAVLHVPEHLPSCQSPTWTSQYSGRQRVQGTTGQMGLATPPQNLSQNQPNMGTTDNRSICIQTKTPTTSIL